MVIGTIRFFGYGGSSEFRRPADSLSVKSFSSAVLL